MNSRRRKTGCNDSRTVRVRGHRYLIIDRIRAAGRMWPILEKTATGDRRQFKVFDSFAGPSGDLRHLILLPKNQASWQQIEVLRRVSTTSSNLPTIVECRRDRESIVLVMTWVHGGTLREYLDAVNATRCEPPSPTESLRLIRGLAHSLAQLHRHRQIIHGDLRPDNLILATQPSRLVVIDFGSAWTAEAARRSSPGDGFIPSYAAPELQSGVGEFCDSRCDQFSTGVILFELLTGKLPYGGAGGSVLQLESREVAGQRFVAPGRLVRSRQIPDSLWRQIDAHVSRSLSLSPHDRFPTPGAWLDSFDSLNLSIEQPGHPRWTSPKLTRVAGWLSRRLRGFKLGLPFLRRKPHE